MSFIQIFLIAFGLAMDAFAVALCKGLKMQKKDYKFAWTIAIFFGSFQAFMTMIRMATWNKFCKIY